MQNMKNSEPAFRPGLQVKIIFTYFILPSFLALWLQGCSKEEPARSRKELISYALAGSVRPDSIKANIKWLEAMGTRFALADNRRQVASAIKERFIRMGYNDTRLDSFMINVTYRQVSYSQWQYNVIATLEGLVQDDTASIIGAHYDNILSSSSGDPFTVAYGANDNASGVAAVLEVARVMKKNSYLPKSRILFITYAAEELGLKGSYVHSAYAAQQYMKLRCMLNNDMVAYCPFADRQYWFVNIIDYENSRELRLSAQELAEKYTCLRFINDNKYRKQSDSYPYSLKGYQALFFIGQAPDPNYHTLKDVSAVCNFDFCAEVVKLNCAILVEKNE